MLVRLALSIRERRITSSLTGLDLSAYPSMPNSPALGSGETTDFSPSQGTSLQSAKNMLTAAAGSSTAKALRSRFWGANKDIYDSDDSSETSSTLIAPTILQHSPISPRLSSFPLSQNPPTSAASLPSSASTLLNKYAASFSQSDAAAALSKATTNSYITALQWREQAPSTLSKLRTDLSEKVSGAAGAAKTIVRPPSPGMDPPFTPPTVSTGRYLSPDGGVISGSSNPNDHKNSGDTVSSSGERRHSLGPKPLLLSSSARRASGAGSNSHDVSPSTSRRPSNANLPQIGLGIPSSLQEGSASTPSHRSRTPSPTAQYRPMPHTRATSATNLGSYKIGGRNGIAEHSRAGSLAMLHISNLHPSVPPEERNIEQDLPVSSLSIATGQNTLYNTRRSLQHHPFSVVRTKAASNDLEVLDDGLTSTTEEGTIPPTPVDNVLQHLQKSVIDNTPFKKPTTPPLSSFSNFEKYSLTDNMPLSPTSKLARQRPRTTSLVAANDIQPPVLPPYDALKEAPPFLKGRRKLASSRKIARTDSIGSDSNRSLDSRSSFEY